MPVPYLPKHFHFTKKMKNAKPDRKPVDSLDACQEKQCERTTYIDEIYMGTLTSGGDEG
jgi:hypothetical protein